jgi:hypothetical protein
MSSYLFDAFFSAFRKDRNDIDALINSLSASSGVSGSQLTVLSTLTDRWGQLRQLHLTANSDIPSTLSNAKITRDVMDDIGRGEMAAIHKHIAVISSDPALGITNWTVKGLVASGRSALSASTHSAALALSDLYDKLIAIYPSISNTVTNGNIGAGDGQVVNEYLRKSDHVYNELSAALHPDRSLSSHLFTNTSAAPIAFGKRAQIHRVDPGDGNLYAGSAYAGDDPVYMVSGAMRLQTFNANDAALLTANDTSFTCVAEEGFAPWYFDGRGSASVRTALELPIFYSNRKNKVNHNVTLRCDLADQSDIPFSVIEDTAGVAAIAPYLLDVTGTVRLRSSAGVLKRAISVNVGYNKDTMVSVYDVAPGDYITFQLTAPTESAPAAGTYNLVAVLFDLVDIMRNAPRQTARVIDLIGEDGPEWEDVESFLEHGVVEGIELLRELNDYLEQYTSGSIVKVIDSYYQNTRIASDTLASIDDSIFHFGWWLSLTNGLTQVTKRKLYKIFYNVVVRDMLNAARVNVEFAEYVVSR